MPTSKAATRWMIWSLSCVSSSTSASLRSDDQRAVARRSRRARGESDPRAQGNSEGPKARLPAPGLSTASDDQGHPASAGNRSDFHPGTGAAAGRHRGSSANAWNRCAKRRSRRSRSTVDGKVMWSHGVQLCALILRVLNETLRARYQRHQGGIAGRSAHDAAYRQQRQRTIAAGRSISGLNLMSTAGRREHRRR